MGLAYRKRRCINNCNRRLIEVNQSSIILYSQIKKKAKINHWINKKMNEWREYIQKEYSRIGILIKTDYI